MSGRPAGTALRIGRMADGQGTASVAGRSREQHLRALQHANEVRSARAKLKKDLAAGTIQLAQILSQPPPYVRTARVRDLLLVLPKIGSVKAGRILTQCGIAHSKTLAGLTDRQRAELLRVSTHSGDVAHRRFTRLHVRDARAGQRRVRVAVDERPVRALALERADDLGPHRGGVGGVQIDPVSRLPAVRARRRRSAKARGRSAAPCAARPRRSQRRAAPARAAPT